MAQALECENQVLLAYIVCRDMHGSVNLIVPLKVNRSPIFDLLFIETKNLTIFLVNHISVFG